MSQATRDTNIDRIARQYAEAIVAHVNHVNAYGLNDQRFDDERDRLAAVIVQGLYRTDARWLADQQAVAQP